MRFQRFSLRYVAFEAASSHGDSRGEISFTKETKDDVMNTFAETLKPFGKARRMQRLRNKRRGCPAVRGPGVPDAQVLITEVHVKLVGPFLQQHNGSATYYA